MFPFNQNFIVDDYVCTYAVPYNDLYVNSSNNNPDSDGSSWEKAFSNLSAALNLISMWNFSNVTIHIAGADGGAVDYTGIGVNTGFTLNNSFDRLIIIGEFGNPVFNAGGSGRIFTISATNVTLINLNITSSAGPIYSTGANLSIINCSFINNTGNSIQNTGAGLIVNGSNFIGTGATINSNNFYLYYSYFINNNQNCISGSGFNVYYSYFINNTVTAINSDYNFNLYYSHFINNKNTPIRFAVTYYYYAWGVYNCSFINNSGSDGGAIYYQFGSSGDGFKFDVVNSTFINNTATTGGAIYFNTYNDYSARSTFLVNNCTFINNTATTGGAIRAYFSGNDHYFFSY
ncbi:right-handed parallel beta-helix repeat-containing protein [Methanobrevibacter arboriphilus]|uniref:hypothetical protein n=1 Tax=Methanobrevibacter arboriphilus TaxID=39441 RepID=UPI000A72523E|nr:hypothetical protein [Methanobrevibacter arboriphilus]